jgi:hypothetical protein
MLDALSEFFRNETVREQAWEATKGAVSYGADAASEYIPGTKALLTAAAVVVGGAVVIGGAREAHRRGHLHLPTRENPNPFAKKPAPHKAKISTTGEADSSSHDEPARHTRSHDRIEGEHTEREKSKSRSPSPTRRGSTDQ